MQIIINMCRLLYVNISSQFLEKKASLWRTVGAIDTKFKSNSKYNGKILIRSKQRMDMISLNI